MVCWWVTLISHSCPQVMHYTYIAGDQSHMHHNATLVTYSNFFKNFHLYERFNIKCKRLQLVYWFVAQSCSFNATSAWATATQRLDGIGQGGVFGDTRSWTNLANTVNGPLQPLRRYFALKDANLKYRCYQQSPGLPALRPVLPLQRYCRAAKASTADRQQRIIV
jgi:hypothetical protein